MASFIDFRMAAGQGRSTRVFVSNQDAEAGGDKQLVVCPKSVFSRICTWWQELFTPRETLHQQNQQTRTEFIRCAKQTYQDYNYIFSEDDPNLHNVIPEGTEISERKLSAMIYIYDQREAKIDNFHKQLAQRQRYDEAFSILRDEPEFIPIKYAEHLIKVADANNKHSLARQMIDGVSCSTLAPQVIDKVIASIVFALGADVLESTGYQKEMAKERLRTTIRYILEKSDWLNYVLAIIKFNINDGRAELIIKTIIEQLKEMGQSERCLEIGKQLLKQEVTGYTSNTTQSFLRDENPFSKYSKLFIHSSAGADDYLSGLSSRTLATVTPLITEMSKPPPVVDPMPKATLTEVGTRKEDQKKIAAAITSVILEAGVLPDFKNYILFMAMHLREDADIDPTSKFDHAKKEELSKILAYDLFLLRFILPYILDLCFKKFRDQMSFKMISGALNLIRNRNSEYAKTLLAMLS